jgi:hypothetical protein
MIGSLNLDKISNTKLGILENSNENYYYKNNSNSSSCCSIGNNKNKQNQKFRENADSKTLVSKEKKRKTSIISNTEVN